MKRPDPQSGFSIVDMIIGLSIVAIAIVGIMLAQQNYVRMTSQVEASLRAIALGNSVMQTIRMHRFDEETKPPWSISYGTDTGESGMSNYDDIDDYAGATWDHSSYGYAGYSVNTRVFCIDLESSWVDSVGPGKNYKRIIVSVSNSTLDEPIVLSSIYAGVHAEE